MQAAKETERATRSRMLLTTSRLLQTQGYHGTGLSQILAEAAAPRGSMYFHFPGGKEELAVEALRKSQAWVTRAMEAAFERGGGDVRAGLRSFVEAFTRQLTASDFAEGCPFATVALESAALPDAVRRACDDAYAGWHTMIAERIGVVEPDRKRAASLATLVLAAFEGALVLAKARRDIAPLRAVSSQLDSILSKPVRKRPHTTKRRRHA